MFILSVDQDIVITMPSSVVFAMNYNASTSTLTIEYVSGSVYEYKNVPEYVYEEMKKAKSKGKFLNQKIKDKYLYEKIK